MAEELDVDKIVEETVVKPTEEVAAVETTTTEKTDEEKAEIEKLRKENERIKKANATLNAKLKEKETAPEPEPEPEVDPNDELATREGWLKKIETTSQETARKMVAPILEASFRRANARFVKAHPEYAAPEAKEKLKSILEAAKASGHIDEEDILNAMGQAWASQNWRELEAKAQGTADSRRRAQQVTAKAAAGSESDVEVAEDFTEEEREEAAKFGKTPEAYRRAAKLLKETSMNL